MERNIPDVRDIFGRTVKSKQQELRSYDCSPRSRRRNDAMDSYESRLQSYHSPEARPIPKKSSSRNRSEDFPDTRSGNRKSDDRNTSSKSKDASHYSNRTLTERDIRHLERHLSMKKTIRKQISRNLAQAFVDDPDLVFRESSTNSPSQKGSKATVERSFTLTRAKVSKSEQNVLDLLKDNEPDSGHCSADNPNSSDDDSNDIKSQRHHVKQEAKKQGSRQLVAERKYEQPPPCKDDGKFSFWKMFSVKNKGKR